MEYCIVFKPFAAFVLLLAACAPPPPPDMLETRLIDRSFIAGGGSSPQGAKLRFAGKLLERNGGTMACVAIGHNDHPAAKLAAAEMRVALRFEVDGECLDARLRFAPIYPSLDIGGRAANCADIGVAWNPRFGQGDVALVFRRFRL